jgi:hypothetical protein
VAKGLAKGQVDEKAWHQQKQAEEVRLKMEKPVISDFQMPFIRSTPFGQKPFGQLTIGRQTIARQKFGRRKFSRNSIQDICQPNVGVIAMLMAH